MASEWGERHFLSKCLERLKNQDQNGCDIRSQLFCYWIYWHLFLHGSLLNMYFVPIKLFLLQYLKWPLKKSAYQYVASLVSSSDNTSSPGIWNASSGGMGLQSLFLDHFFSFSFFLCHSSFLPGAQLVLLSTDCWAVVTLRQCCGGEWRGGGDKTIK